MNRNRKMAAILVVAAALVLGLIVAVGHSGASTGKASSNKPNGSSSIAANDPTGFANKALTRAGAADPSDTSNTGQSGNGTSGTGESTTTTVPGGGGGRPPFHRPVDQVGGTAGRLDPGTPPATTAPPNSNPVSDPGNCGVHKQGYSCP